MLITLQISPMDLVSRCFNLAIYNLAPLLRPRQLNLLLVYLTFPHLSWIRTIYSAGYNLQKDIIYLYYNRQFDKPYVLDVTQELAKSGRYRKVALKDLISDIGRYNEN